MQRLSRRTRPLDERGVTVMELLLTVSVLAIIFPAIIAFFFGFSDSMAFFEVSDNLKKENQEAIDAIYDRVLQNKRLYQNDADGIAMLARLSATGVTVGGVYDGFPALVGGGKLPTICDTCRYEDGTSAANIGNALLLLTQEPRIVCEDVTATAGKRTVQVDIYKMRCFYLSPLNPNPVNDAGQVVASRLVEWVSAPLVDFNMIDYLYLQDPILARNVVTRLMNPTVAPVPQQAVTYAIDPTAATANAIYRLVSGGSPPYSLQTAAKIARDFPVTYTMGATTYTKDKEPGINVWTHMGTRGSGRIYPNAVASNDPKRSIPRYGVASGSFPGGFEVGIIGPESGRQVLVRLVHLGKSLKRVTSVDQFQIMGCKDTH